MSYAQEPQAADSLIDPDKPKDSSVILDALIHAEKEFRDYNEICRRIDAIYSARSALAGTVSGLGLSDQEYDTFWASMEVLKPAIYAKAPQVIAKPRFSDATPTDKVVAELIERVVNSEFERNGIDMHLREVRDDLALLNRGVLWVTYEAKDGRKSVCVDHLDRLDYRHEPVRYWPELGWEARCAWMTEKQMVKRFDKLDLRTIQQAGFVTRTSRDEEGPSENAKAPVWEVWSKVDNRVYWVTEGVDTILDEGEPHLDLRDFFPGPRPAFGTLRRRSLIPVPDYIRYERHLDQINVLTSRIYSLLEAVRVVGLVPAGGDIGSAIETAMATNENANMILVPVPGAAIGNGGVLVEWLPLDVVATTITGLIQARQQFFADFDRLSGISDIMRGETEAEETLGAQRIKTQYGSVRVKDKVEEIVRLARDAARVAVEIICDKFDKDTLLEISQMVIPSKRDVTRDIEEIKKVAKAELEALGKKAMEAAEEAQAQGQQVDPNQAQQMLQQAQGQIAEKYAPDLQRLANTVVIEDVMEVIKDKRDRGLIIDIETDSTVMMDEVAEKQTRNEMFQAVTGSFAALPQFAAMGDEGIKLFGALVNFTLQPYTRGNRQIQSQLDALVENAPEIAAKMAAQAGDGDAEGLAEAQKGLAEAEKMKAQAAMAGVQAKAALDQAENQRKMAELQQRAQTDAAKAQQENAKLQLQVAQATTSAQQAEQKLAAEIDKLRADTYAILVKAGVAQDQQALNEFKTVKDVQSRETDQAMAAQGQQQDAAFQAQEHERADRGEERADRQQDFSEQSGDRQMSLAERQAEQGGE